VSADAVHTPARVCASRIASTGEVLLFAKGYPSTCANEGPLVFREPPVDCSARCTARTVACGHWRLDMCEMEGSTARTDGVARTWPGMAHVCRVRRRVCTALVWTYEWVSGFPHQAGPDRLLALIRAPWARENRLQDRRDVPVREDACPVRTGSAARTLAVLTRVLLAFVDWRAGCPVPSELHLFSAQPLLALRLFTGSVASMKEP
jgi:hypothetical protein